MNRTPLIYFTRKITFLSFVMLSAYTWAQTPFSLDNPTGLTGNQAADKLNQLYQATNVSCNQGTLPAFHCSGILFRAGSDGTPSWAPGPAERESMGVATLYLRKDLPAVAGADYGLALLASSLQTGHRPATACAYPYAMANNTPRDNNGCGIPKDPPSQVSDNDPSSCSWRGINTVQGWLKDYDLNKEQACSLSTHTVPGFSLALNISKTGKTHPLQIWLKDWTVEKGQLPVLAFIYSAGSASGKAQAAKDRSADGRNIPVIRYTPEALNGALFTYHPEDDKVADPEPDYSPQAVAARLQARLDSKVDYCEGGLPAYRCSGLITRATGDSHPLTLSPEAIRTHSASFSFMRGDSGTVEFPGNYQGLILRPNFETLSKNVRAVCLYPANANTRNGNRQAQYNQCLENGITPVDNDYGSCRYILKMPSSDANVDAWISAFQEKNSKGDIDLTQCSFDAHHSAQFRAGMYIGRDFHRNSPWNELILTPWGSADTPIPDIVEAVFYDTKNYYARASAWKIVDKYNQQYKNKVIYAFRLYSNTGKIVYEGR